MARWKPGQSGNPKGKLPGTKHKATMAAQALLDGEAEALTRKAIERAMQGDSIALRLCLDRLVPVRKDRPISVNLPKITGAAGIPEALVQVLENVAKGEITPAEGQALAGMIESYRKGVEIADISTRLSDLEKAIEKSR